MTSETMTETMMMTTTTTTTTTTTMTTTTIQDLPELTLLTLFDQLTLSELLHIDEVCKDWGGRVKREAHLRRRHLVIVEDTTDMLVLERANNCVDSLSPKMLHHVRKFGGEKEEDKENDNRGRWTHNFRLLVRLDRHALFTATLTPHRVDGIIKHLPNLTTLRIVRYSGSLEELQQIIRLLTAFAHQLLEVTLVFYGHYPPPPAAEEPVVERDQHYRFLRQFTLLFGALNHLTALRSLKLHLEGPFTLSGPLRFIDLGDLCARLTTFNLYAGTLVDVASLLKQFAEPSRRLQELLCVDRIDLETHLSFGPRVAAAMRQAYVEECLSYEDHFADLGRFGLRYAHLQELTVHLDGLTIWQLAQALAPSCKALTSLHIWDLEEEEEEEVEEEEVEEEEEEEMEEEEEEMEGNDGPPPPSPENQNRQTPVMPSLKALHLNLHTPSHRFLEHQRLELLFPNLQVVCFIPRRSRCLDCAYQVPQKLAEEPAQVQAAYGRLVQACLRLARVPLARLPKLTLLTTYVGIWQPGRHRPVAFTRDTLAEETFYRLEDTLPSEDEDGDGDGCVAGASVQYAQDEVVEEEDELPFVDIDDFYAEDWLGRGDESGEPMEE